MARQSISSSVRRRRWRCRNNRRSSTHGLKLSPARNVSLPAATSTEEAPTDQQDQDDSKDNAHGDSDCLVVLKPNERAVSSATVIAFAVGADAPEAARRAVKKMARENDA